MRDSPDEMHSVGDPTDDGQLTIRIPNPKVYMARQSLWIGRRGKPRCDHCRTSNLKCDRVLPSCNHCSWAADRECKYTPLPTPAHRGIPRCDRCRQKNFKCDRSLPRCNHCLDDGVLECNYTPKKRHKNQPVIEPTRSLDQKERVKTKNLTDTQGRGKRGNPKGHTFYGQNIASSSSRSQGRSPSPPYHDRESSLEPEFPRHQTGRFSAEYSRAGSSRKSPPALITSKLIHPSSRLSFISHSFPSDHGLIINSSHVEPWAHPSFASLPDFIVQRLSFINSVEIPDRVTFNESLSAFLDSLMDELRETASLTTDVYAAVVRAITQGDTSRLSSRMRAWVSYHHLCSGSDKYYLLLIPRDSVFHVEGEPEERLRQEYCAYVDEEASLKDEAVYPNSSLEGYQEEDSDYLKRTKAFERLPVQTQIYDILTYAHRSHGDSSTMLMEVRRIGIASLTWPMAELYIRLCPLCNLRSKRGSHLEEENTPHHGSA